MDEHVASENRIIIARKMRGRNTCSVYCVAHIFTEIDHCYIEAALLFIKHLYHFYFIKARTSMARTGLPDECNMHSKLDLIEKCPSGWIDFYNCLKLLFSGLTLHNKIVRLMSSLLFRAKALSLCLMPKVLR